MCKKQIFRMCCVIVLIISSFLTVDFYYKIQSGDISHTVILCPFMNHILWWIQSLYFQWFTSFTGTVQEFWPRILSLLFIFQLMRGNIFLYLSIQSSSLVFTSHDYACRSIGHLHPIQSYRKYSINNTWVKLWKCCHIVKYSTASRAGACGPFGSHEA